jgi:hypothetical protein
MWNRDIIEIQQYYEKQGYAKGRSLMREGG